MLILAHGGHWLVSVAYFVPVAGFVVWLVIVTLKERWVGAGRDGGKDRSGAANGAGAAARKTDSGGP